MKHNPYALAVASGVLLALSFPPFHLGFLAFIALIPLLIAARTGPVGVTFRSAFIGGIAFGACLIYWIANLWVEPQVKPFLVGGVGLLCVYFGLSFALPFMALRLARRTFGTTGLLSFPFFFVGLEFLRSLSHLGFPWGSLAYTQTEHIELIQFASATSVAGVSFWVSSVNLMVYFLLFTKVRWSLKLLSLSLFAAAFALPLSQWQWMPKESSKDRVRVALVQAGVAPSLKRSGEDEERLRILIQETERLAKNDVDLVVWPETAVPGYSGRKLHYFQLIQKVSDGLATPILLGAHDWEESNNEQHEFNAAFLVSPWRGVTGTYHKSQLVPFGERMPFDDVFPRLRNVPLGQGQFSAGNEYTVFETDSIRFATLICFESIFPRLVRRFVNNGAQFLVNITEDGWYGRTSGQFQHAEMAVLRCIENRISMARCANTGVSIFIDPYGRVSGRTRTFTRVTESAPIPLRMGETFYSRYGDVFGWSLVIISTILLGLMFVKRRSRI